MAFGNNQTNIKAVITAEDKASAVLQTFGKKTSDASKSVNENLRNSALALTAATAGAVIFGKRAFDAYSQQELAVTRLATGIKNVNSATDKNIDMLIDQADALQKVTRFSDEQYISAQGILSTFQLNQKAIEKLTPRLSDMSEGLARVNGGLPDLEGNAILVAKAIGGEDQAGLSGALRRAGVIMTETQEELLKTGSVEERVALITKVLDQNFKGMATAAGDTAAGKVTILRNQFGEFEEKAGEVIAKALVPILDLLNQHPLVLKTVTLALGGLTAAFVAVKAAAAISAIIKSVTVALGSLTAAAGTATAAMTTLSAVSIAGWAALVVADIFLVVKAVQSVKKALSDLEATQKAKESYERSKASVHQHLLDLSKNGTPEQKARANAKLAKGFDTGGFTGHGSATEIAGVVHKGEYVVPKEHVDQTSGLPMVSGGGGPPVNVIVNVGMYAGSEQEKRVVAHELFRALQDVAASRSMTVAQMLGVKS